MYKAWMLAAAVTLAPLAAHAQATLDRPHQILGEGVQRVVQGNFADAEKKLREALREDPTLREAHYNLAVALREQGQLREAVSEYRVAAHLFSDEPRIAQSLYGEGLAREALGDKAAWDPYLSFARPLAVEQESVKLADLHREALNGVIVPGRYQKAAR
jgi:tetratricopeptide (TPR) repeat protein